MRPLVPQPRAASLKPQAQSETIGLVLRLYMTIHRIDGSLAFSTCTICHCSQVYLPMSYVYGMRGTGALTPLVRELRQELYPRAYSSINWNAARNQCAAAPYSCMRLTTHAPACGLLSSGACRNMHA